MHVKRPLHVGIAGATGMVGREFLALLDRRAFPIANLRLFASARSVGSTIVFRGRELPVEDLATADPAGLEVAFFSAGRERALEHAPRFAAAGAVVIDNSSAFREDPASVLIVPEVNGDAAGSGTARIIANPNCSTIILLLPLAALQRAFGVEEVIAATYQAVSGAGRAALEDLHGQARAFARGEPEECRFYDRSIFMNLIPQIGAWTESGDCLEEAKMVRETRRILADDAIRVYATTVRVPVERCHSEAVHVRLRRPASVEEVRRAIAAMPGVALHDLPTPRELAGREEVFVGRIRCSTDDPRIVRFWVVGDQLWKGAALNAIQIAELLIANGTWVGA